MPRILALATASAVAATAALLAVPATSAAPAPTVTSTTAAAKTTATRFAMKAAGYGTRLQGGLLPAGSDTTAYQVIGCTNKAGLDRVNYEADATVPGVARVFGVDTRVWSTAEDGAVSVMAQHDVARVVIPDEAGQLVLRAVTSFSRSWYDAKGYQTETETSIGQITFAGQAMPIPTPGTPLVIPGVATITVGHSKEAKGASFARAFANAVKVELHPTMTQLRIAHSATKLSGGVTVGLFRGFANGTRANAAAENIKSGPTPLAYVPCQGTKGVVRKKSIAKVNLNDQIVVEGLNTQVMGKQDRRLAKGFSQGSIASVDLGDGQLVINAIKGRVNVKRLKSGKLVANTDGTNPGELVVDGEQQGALPNEGFEIPGLAKVETNIVTKRAGGLEVVAVRITLLDGSGAVVDLGQAKLQIARSGR